MPWLANAEIPANGPHPTNSTAYAPIPNKIITKGATIALNKEPIGAWDIVNKVAAAKLDDKGGSPEGPILAEDNPWESSIAALGAEGDKEAPNDIRGSEEAVIHELKYRLIKLNIPEVAV